MSEDNYEMRSRACPQCYLCGTQGKELYAGLTDRLFGAPGVWNLKQCLNDGCGLIWLDPVPTEEDIALAYRSYYTHQSEVAKKKIGIAVLAYRILWGILVRATGLIKEQQAIRTRYLGEQVPGKLMEIGCGAGDNLVLMRTLGWVVEGVEIDPIACLKARQMHGLTVHEGTLESRNYPENSFDAITMNHVIEHVFDPVAILKECFRIIKPGGKVVVITPNTDSWGHHEFQENWRGLEPPRHIHIFSPKSMKKCAEAAGFESMEVRTTPANADVITKASLHLKDWLGCDMLNLKESNLSYIQKIIWKCRLLQYHLREYYLWKSNPNLGEEVVMICQK